jgi:transcription termination factor Rho
MHRPLPFIRPRFSPRAFYCRASSGTRKEELLIDAKPLEGIHFFRRVLVQQKIEAATGTMIARLSKTKTNAEFLKLLAR